MPDVLPHHISCGLLVLLVFRKNSLKDGELSEAELPPPTKQKFLLAILRIIQCNEVSWHDFRSATSLIDVDIHDALVGEMLDLRSLDSLLDLVKSFDSLLDGQLMHATSVLALFLRRLSLNFRKLTFTDISKLMSNVERYLGKSDAMLADGEVSVVSTASCDDDSMEVSGNQSMDMSMNMSGIAEKSEVKPTGIERQLLDEEQNEHLSVETQNQAEQFISNQAALLERNESIALPAHELQRTIDKIRRKFPRLVNAHYLSFLNCLRMFELNKSLASLHRFFDYKIFQETKPSESATDLDRHQQKFKRFRYCALNMGILHYCHGNYTEASTSLQEAIRIAQETNDQNCLHHSMFWSSLVKMHIGNGNLSIMKQLANKVLEKENEENIDPYILTSTHELELLAVLRLSLHDAMEGGRAPQSVFEDITCVLMKKKLAESAQVLRSALWGFYGYRRISAICCSIPLQHCVTPMLQNHSNPLRSVGTPTSDETLCLSLCQLARHTFEQGYFAESRKVLQLANNTIQKHSKSKKNVIACESRIEFDACVACRDISGARKYNSAIAMLDRMDNMYRKCLLDVLVGNISEAERNISSLLKELSQQKKGLLNDEIPASVMQARLLLLLTEIHLQSSESLNAVDSALKLISFARTRKMRGVEVDGAIAMARCQLLMSLPNEAEDGLKRIAVFALSQGTIYQQGLVYLYLSLCSLEKRKMLSLGQRKPNSNDDVEDNKVLKNLEASLDCFTTCNAQARIMEVYYQQALLYNELGDIQERNKSSTKYRTLHEKLQHFINIVIV